MWFTTPSQQDGVTVDPGLVPMGRAVLEARPSWKMPWNLGEKQDP